jgi:hypothetical protein
MRLRRRLAVPAAALVAGLGVAACGDDDFPNEGRPSSPVSVAAVITDTEVSVSPEGSGAIGGGLATFTIANLSSEPGALVLEGPTDAASEEILPGDTGRLKTELLEGEYLVSAGEDSNVAEVELTVGAQRPSARNELLLP